jgi:tetratricopeptide (TPR) repeat protein
MRAALVLGLWLLALPALAAGKQPARNDSESAARTAFTDGRYADALAGYQKLYDDTHHPTYLRNVGRCQQMLKQPDAAIAAFREYLRISPDLPATARDQVEGFIRDMQELKRQRAEASAPPAHENTPPAPSTSFERPASAPAETRPPYVSDSPAVEKKERHGWLWATGGAVAVAAGVLAVVLLSRGPRSACPDCTLPTVRIDTR